MNNEEDNEMDFDIKQILEEMKKYAEIPEEDIIDFILQDRKGDMAFFYYKQMLLQLVEFDEHYLKLLGIYDRETEHETDLREHMHSFAHGNTERMQKVIEFISRRMQIRKDWGMWWKLESLTEQWIKLTDERNATDSEMGEKQDEIAEQRLQLEELDDIQGIEFLFRMRGILREKKELNQKIQRGEKDCEQLSVKLKAIESQLEQKMQELKEWFEIQGLQELGEEYIHDLTTRKNPYENISEYRI